MRSIDWSLGLVDGTFESIQEEFRAMGMGDVGELAIAVGGRIQRQEEPFASTEEQFLFDKLDSEEQQRFALACFDVVDALQREAEREGLADELVAKLRSPTNPSPSAPVPFATTPTEELIRSVSANT